MRMRVACGIVIALLTGHALAQGLSAAYPSKAIRLIVPFSPGGPADMIGRPLAQALTDAWGQPVVLDHRAGAGGTIGAELLAKSPPDGYTLMVATPGILAVTPGLQPKLPYDTLRDFAGVTNAV